MKRTRKVVVGMWRLQLHTVLLKNNLYLTAPRWWLVHGGGRPCPASLDSEELHCTAQSESSVSSQQLAVKEGVVG